MHLELLKITSQKPECVKLFVMIWIICFISDVVNGFYIINQIKKTSMKNLNSYYTYALCYINIGGDGNFV